MSRTLTTMGLLALWAHAACAPVHAQECVGWSQLHPVNSMGEIANEALVFDSARGRAVFYNGSIDSVRKTWEWDGANWFMVAGDDGDGTPRSSRDHAMVFDSSRGVSVLFGGHGLDGHPADDTREWNGTKWLNPQASPGLAFQEHAMAFDSARDVTVMFGGDDGFEFVEATDYTVEYDGEKWTFVEPQVRPSPRYGHVMAYDESRGVVVLFGGHGPNQAQVLGDTWEYDGLTWSERKIPGPGKRTEAAMAYDSDRNVCVLFGGDGEGVVYDDTWEYDGHEWTQADTPKRPPPRGAHAMAYDSARKEILLYGGQTVNGGILGDTWVFRCTPSCYADFTGEGTLDLFDFLGFVNAFNAAAPNADCDGNGSLDLFDFLCYTNKFNAGC